VSIESVLFTAPAVIWLLSESPVPYHHGALRGAVRAFINAILLVTCARNRYHADLNETYTVGNVAKQYKDLIKCTYDATMKSIDIGIGHAHGLIILCLCLI